MSWFDEQIKQRKSRDDELFTEAVEAIADSITGNNKSNKLEDTNDAIKSILEHFGFSSKIEVPSDITDFCDRLSYYCRPCGLMYRRVKLSERWYKDCIGAILAFKKSNGEAVALLSDGMGYYYFESGKRKRFTEKDNEKIEKEAYCFYKPLPNKKLSMGDVLKFALHSISIKDAVLLIVFMAAATLVGLQAPKISYFLYSYVVDSKSTQMLFSTVFFLICVSISTLLFRLFQNLYNSIIETKMSISVQSAIMMRILSLPASFFRNYSAGELSERTAKLTELTKTIAKLFFGCGLSSLFSLVYIYSIFTYSPSLALPSIIVIVVSVGFSLIVTLIQQKITRDVMEIESKESGIKYSMVSGIKKIKVSGAEKRAFSRWSALYSKKAQKLYNPPLIIKISTSISLAITLAGTAVIYFVAIKNGINMAEFNAFTTANGMVFGAFASLSLIITSVASIKPVLEMIKPILETEPEMPEERERISKLKGHIEFSNVCFTYAENMPSVVDHMSFTIKPNQYIGIVGKTGCGKSTLIRLLLGFEKAQKGTVYFDGKDINSLDLKSLRQKIGVVMQDSRLFAGDIYSNITISAPQLTLDEAWEAAEIAGIADDIAAMPMGMHTLIAEGGGGISGGQKQRLIIARAIAPKPKIVIFDEATSALDNITQKKVSEALDKLNCTRIVIAHRLSTIKNCDRILYLGDGRILEDGSYDELIEKNGLFAELVKRQQI